MFAYIKGELAQTEGDFVVIDVNGIGYKVYMPISTMEKLGELGSIVKVHTYYYVREDNISIYGFRTKEELKMFELLQAVSGIGAKSANVILSTVEPSAFALAIITNDTSGLTKIPGIGAKTAARMILELKDKLKKTEAISNMDDKISTIIKIDGKVDEAISALKVLGYNLKQIEEAILKIETEELELEDIIRKALSVLGR